MSSNMNETNNEFGTPSNGMTRLEEAMTHPASTAGLWVASEAHTSLEFQAVIKDPPVPNGDFEVRPV